MKHIQIIPGQKASNKVAMRQALLDMREDKSIKNGALALVNPETVAKLLPKIEVIQFEQLVAIRESDSFGVQQDFDDMAS